MSDQRFFVRTLDVSPTFSPAYWRMDIVEPRKTGSTTVRSHFSWTRMRNRGTGYGPNECGLLQGIGEGKITT